METYAEPRDLVDDPDFKEEKKRALAGLTDDMIDAPIVDLVNALNRLPHCFTIQCCYGHFVFEGQDDPESLEPLPDSEIEGEIEYRIAYISFCIENSERGRDLLDALGKVPEIDPDHIQLCSAEWFWERRINTYSLQVEPDRFKDRDTAIIDYAEALHVQEVRDRFFEELGEIVTGQE